MLLNRGDAKKRAVNREGGQVAENESRYRAPALEKGLDVLELLAAQTEPMTLTAIVNQLGRSHGELFRMVQVLEHRGYIEQESGGEGYRLTDRLFSLGMQQPRTATLLEIVTSGDAPASGIRSAQVLPSRSAQPRRHRRGGADRIWPNSSAFPCESVIAAH